MSASDTVSAVRNLLDAGVRAGAFPGAVAAWRVGETDTLHVCVGSSALRPRRAPAVRDVSYDLASLTKPLATATLAVLAARHQTPALSATVAEVLSPLPTGPVGEATVRDLLCHTSGLPAWVPLYALTGGDASRTLEVLVDLPLHAPPGRRVVYSCPGFLLLGLLLERQLGRPLAELLLDHVLRPAGVAADLVFAPDDRPVAGGAASPCAELALVRQLGLDPSLIPTPGEGLPDDGNARFLGGLAGNAGLWGTAHGLVELARHHLPGSGRLLTDQELDLMAAVATPGMEQERGLGWQVASSPGCSAGPSLSPDSIGHTGFTGCSLWIDRRRRAILALVSNRHHPGHRNVDLHPLRRRFHSIVLG